MSASQHSRDTLWTMIQAPIVWALHFTLCYVVAAIWCAKAESWHVSLAPARLAVAGLTLIALAWLAVLTMRAWRQSGLGEGHWLPHDADTIEARHHFLGTATLFLCGLSVVAVIFTALPAALIGSCR